MPHVYSAEGVPHFHLSAPQAKKEGLFFSVTEHQRILAKPALENWKLAEHLKTAHKNPPHDGEDEAAYLKRVRQLQWKGGGGAAALGTRIHEALESVFLNEKAKQEEESKCKDVDANMGSTPKNLQDLDVEMRAYVAPALRWFHDKKFKILEIEKTLVNKEEGYAGTVDLAVLTPCGKKSIVDWKSRGKTAGRKIVAYPGQPEQAAAYAAAYFGPEAVRDRSVWGANVVLSTEETTPEGEARFTVITYTPEQMAYHYETFCLTCELWRRTEGYDAREGCAK